LQNRSKELDRKKNTQGLTSAENVELENIDQERFRLLEYYKVKFKGDWYTTLVDKLVLRSNAEFGFLGSYNSAVGNVPFERFYVVVTD